MVCGLKTSTPFVNAGQLGLDCTVSRAGWRESLFSMNVYASLTCSWGKEQKNRKKRCCQAILAEV